ncbi:hypothetical protein GCM10009563_19240 [Subtercola frigoramans]
MLARSPSVTPSSLLLLVQVWMVPVQVLLRALVVLVLLLVLMPVVLELVLADPQLLGLAPRRSLPLIAGVWAMWRRMAPSFRTSPCSRTSVSGWRTLVALPTLIVLPTLIEPPALAELIAGLEVPLHAIVSAR